VSADPIVVMGVSGSGKSTIGTLLAARLNRPFTDGDDLHPAANKAKMARGIPLTDADRRPWLDLVGARLAEPPTCVLACSALRRGYRDQLRDYVPELLFVHLTGDPAALATRLTARSGHFMPATLLASQLATLEPPEPDERHLTVSTADTPEHTVETLLAELTAG
jgi:gluconokinase